MFPTALDRGINLIDTAPVYGFGRSEEIVGKALAAGGRRKRAYIATKVGIDWKDGKPFRNARKARIIAHELSIKIEIVTVNALIANYKCPRTLDLREEPLPLSGAGKILKTELRAPYWAGKEKRVN